MIIGADVNVRGVHDDAAARIELPLDVAFGQLPDRLPIATSDQPMSAGTTAALLVRSMTA